MTPDDIRKRAKFHTKPNGDLAMTFEVVMRKDGVDTSFIERGVHTVLAHNDLEGHGQVAVRLGVELGTLADVIGGHDLLLDRGRALKTGLIMAKARIRAKTEAPPAVASGALCCSQAAATCRAAGPAGPRRCIAPGQRTARHRRASGP